MQFHGASLLFAMCLFGRSFAAQFMAVQSAKMNNPVPQVVGLMKELRGRVAADGRVEQASYDQYACWCEDTMATKAAEISTGKADIEKLQTLILKLKGDIAKHGADIKTLEKDIAANLESQREATELRSKEASEYEEQKIESEQCIGALEAAINALTGAGTSHTASALQEAQLLSVASRIRALLTRPTVARSMSADDLDLVRRFVDKPDDVMGAHTPGAFLSAAQIANNPFGDYAPQSTRIQGVLKGMYETFAGDLEKANAEESNKVKAFQDLMATKAMEEATLKATLLKTQQDEASKTQNLANSKTSLDDTQAQVVADETFFAQTKTTCKTKAKEWSERTRLRTEELKAMDTAVQILSAGDANTTFGNATSTFLQLSARKKGHRGAVAKAYDKLKALATKYKSLSLARLAALTKRSGHFDKVINAIDNMVKLLQEEGKSDIEHKDRCDAEILENTRLQEDLNYTVTKTQKEIRHLNATANELEAKIAQLIFDINETEHELMQMKGMRADEMDAFLKAQSDDAQAIALLEQAIVTLTDFYRKNGIPISLVQNDTAPELGWSGDYQGRNTESGGIIAILSMIKEDLEMESRAAREDESTTETSFGSDASAVMKVLSAQKDAKALAEKEFAQVEFKLVDAGEFKLMKSKDLNVTGEKGAALAMDCAWVQTHFQSRREQRKAEIDGLIEAKNFLLGVTAAEDMS